MAKKITLKEALNLTAKDIKLMSLAKFNEAVQVMADAANKRLTRLEEAGLAMKSPAYQTRVKGNAKVATKFSTATKIPKRASQRDRPLSPREVKRIRKNYPQQVADKLIEKLNKRIETNRGRALRTEYATIKAFLTEMKTASLKGAREHAAAVESNLKDYDATKFDNFFYYKNGKPKKGRLKRFWNAFRKYEKALMKNDKDLYNRGSGERLSKFEEVIFPALRDEEGKVRARDIIEWVKGEYEAREKQEGSSNGNDGESLSTRVDAPRKRSAETWQPKVSFESVDPLATERHRKSKKK